MPIADCRMGGMSLVIGHLSFVICHLVSGIWVELRLFTGRVRY
jgi:hypothetical protein